MGVVMEWTREKINELLSTNPRAVERGIVRLYQNQTLDERSSDATMHHNNTGFNSCSAKKGSYYAKWVMSGRQLTGHHLENARKIAIKHSRQLVEIANTQKA